MEPVNGIANLAETENLDIRGTSGTFYGNQPVNFVKEVMDAAKKRFFLANFAKVFKLAPGQRQIAIPRRTTYLNNAGTTFDTAGSDNSGTGAGTGPYANTKADITWTTVNNTANTIVEPLPYLAGVTFNRYDLRSSMVDWVKWGKDELSEAIGDRVDKAIATQMGSDDGLTFAQSGAVGAIQLYGGDATADSSLAAGDTMTPDLVVDGMRYLRSVQNWYRDGGSGLSGTLTFDSTVEKNGWENDTAEPYVLFIGPSQENALRKDSQFTNAAEYGDNTVVQNGEIGKYQGARIIVTNNLESVTGTNTGPDNTSVTSGVTMTRCILMKSMRAIALVWGMEPSIEAFPYLSRDQIRVGLYSAYGLGVIHSDAVVCIDVSDD